MPTPRGTRFLGFLGIRCCGGPISGLAMTRRIGACATSKQQLVGGNSWWVRRHIRIARSKILGRLAGSVAGQPEFALCNGKTSWLPATEHNWVWHTIGHGRGQVVAWRPARLPALRLQYNWGLPAARTGWQVAHVGVARSQIRGVPRESGLGATRVRALWWQDMGACRRPEMLVGGTNMSGLQGAAA